MNTLPPYPKDEARAWSGMTLDQIRMRRTLVQARMEIQKYKLRAEVEHYREKSPFFGGKTSLFSRVAGAFSLAEYAVFAIRLFRLASPLFRRKK